MAAEKTCCHPALAFLRYMKLLFKFLVCLCLLGLALPINAQLLEADTARWAYGLTGNLYLSKGNVDRLLLRTDASVKHLGEGWGFASEQTYQYGTFGPLRTENDVFSRNFAYLKPQKRVYPYLMVWLERNLRKQINFRYQIGPGISADIVKQSNYLLKVSLTATWEHSRFAGNDFVNADPQASPDIATPRLTPRLFGEHRMFAGRLLLQHETWFQQSLRFRANRRFHQVLVWQLPLGKVFAFRSRLDYMYEHVGLRGVAQGDLYLTAGVQVKW